MDFDDHAAGELFSVCNSGNAELLKQLIASEQSILNLLSVTKNRDSSTAKRISDRTIYAACVKGHYNIVKCLLKAGVDPNVAGATGTPIYAAAKAGNLDVVKLLVESGAEYKSTRGGYSPLFAACSEGRLNVLRFFVNRGADLYSFDPPLIFIACFYGHVDIVKYLMEEMQFDVNQSDQGFDSLKIDGQRSLLYGACQNNRMEVARFLIHQGAAITRTIAARFPAIITKIVQEYFQPAAAYEVQGFYHARLKEMRLLEAPWSFFASFASTLTKVDLSSNCLSTLPSEMFQMSALRVLNVSYNRISKICSENTPWKCYKLCELDASHNQLVSVPHGLFSLPELTTLSLSCNLLATLPGDPADPSTNPEENGGLFEWSCCRLKKLDISHNCLKALPDVCNNLHSLTSLCVSHNSLHDLPFSVCLGCVNLIHLDVSDNYLTDLPIGASSYWMHTLETLDLSRNCLTNISRKITEMSHITMLNLSNNKIEGLPPTNYWTGTRMNKLDLSYNMLTSLTTIHPSQYAVVTSSPKNKNKISANATHQKDEQQTDLPIALWFKSLHTLLLQDNQLKFLPDYIGSFTSLIRLNISNNPAIQHLPLSLGLLRNCSSIMLNNVPVSNVPPNFLPGTLEGSTKHLLAYLRSQLRKCIPYNQMKLMVAGLQGRGKTTLLSVLRDPTAPLPENVSTVGVNVSSWVAPGIAAAKKGKGSDAQLRDTMTVVFSTWDLAGQEVYYATHQCFLSCNTLYLVVWNMEEGEKGIEYLQPWLLNIQSRAPHSPVIIVGTHMDKLPATKAKDLKEHYKQQILSIYDRVGFPKLSSVMFVSCVTKEGIKELQRKIHSTAVHAKDRSTNEYIVGMQVPSSYVTLQRLIAEEAKDCQAKMVPPFLDQKGFTRLAERIPENDIIDPEELSLAAQFLHNHGVLLHYNDQLKGLDNLYFIDPIWLADMLAEVITVPEKQAFVHNGLLKESNVPFIFRDNKRFPSQFFQQYLQLLERFEIALSLGNGLRLIPSMLPVQRPILSFVEPQPIIKYDESTVLETVKSPTQDSSSDYPVITDPALCIRRHYKMSYIPSGFWSRFISRLIINLKRSGLVEDHNSAGCGLVYWRRGILVTYPAGKFLVESSHHSVFELPGVATQDVFITVLGESVAGLNHHNNGVDITVWSISEDFSAMGYVVDQLESLIEEWFPGLLQCDSYGNCLIQRLVLWKVPSKYSTSKKDEKEERDGWSIILSDPDQSAGEMVVFSLEQCAKEALAGDYIQAHDYKICIPMTHLVPDLLLTDLPNELKIDHSQFEFDRKSPANVLGRGGSGAVYRGKYKRHTVAIKEFLTQSQAEEVDPLKEEDKRVTSSDALQLFRDLRQEVTVLAGLSHPNIVSLLGVSMHPMCIVLELAPMGSLFGILDRRIEALKVSEVDTAVSVPRMPGGVLGHMMSTKIALQVALAICYLHENDIVYRDLKSDNVLVWSLDLNEKVNVKLADYGISRFANPGGVKGEEGTPGYMAPEAIRRRGETQAFDEKVDIFSFAMLLYELLTGQIPLKNLRSIEELNQAVSKGERPLLQDGNLEPSFPSMVDLMMDCWKQSSSERPSANEVVARICEPGFVCRKHTITRYRDHPLQKIDTIYARPAVKEDTGPKSYAIWTWAKQDDERQFSILDTRKGVFNLPEKPAPGGRVYAMTATGEIEKRIWIGTSQCEIQVYGYRTVGDPQCLWAFSVKDSVLSLSTEVEEGKVKRVFASLANGRLCIFSCKSVNGPLTPTGDAEFIPEACKVICDNEFAAEAKDWSDPLILRLADVSQSAKCMVFVGSDRLWCGCGNSIIVVDTVQLKVVHQLTVFNKRSSLVNELVSDGRSVWGVGRNLSCVLEWDVATYNLSRVFDCSLINPTEKNVICDPSKCEEIFDTDSKMKSPLSIPGDDSEQVKGSLTISNDQIDPSQSYGPYSKNRCTRRTLRTITGRPKIVKPQTAYHVRTNGSTRTTSVLIVDRTLWIGRGMGDVLIIDISGGDRHGKVLVRLATGESHKYGNRSYHKLVMVGCDYVVSSQWLEPVDGRKAGDADEILSAHQEITVWDAWGHKEIEECKKIRAGMVSLPQDSDTTAATDSDATAATDSIASRS